MRFADDIASAFGLLTRLPLPRAARPSRMADGVWAWPLAGLAIGLIGGLVYWLAWRAHLAAWLGAALAVITTVIATGALHEDGLADTADGIGGGRDAAHRLTIMKDSRIGSYGALALIASVGLRVGALAELAEPRLVLHALILAGMVGRAVIPGVVLLSAPARPGGLGASLGRLARPRVYAAWAIALLGVLWLAPPHAALRVLIGAVLVAVLMAWTGRRALGGYTGDTLGAGEQLGEIMTLLVLVAV